MKKKSSVLLAVLMALLVGIAGVGALTATTSANADASPTIGKFVSWDGYEFTGTSATPAENKTVISYKWSSAAFWRALLYVENCNNTPTIELNLTADADAKISLTIFDHAKVETNYGAPISNDDMTANTAYTKTINNITLPDGATSMCLAFYFDSNTTTDVKKNVTVNSLTVDGVSYTPHEYSERVEAPDTTFKEMTDWTAVNGTLAANTLEKLPTTDEKYETSVKEGAGDVAVTDMSAETTTLTVPFAAPLTAWPTDWTKMFIKFKAEGIKSVDAYLESIEPQQGASGDVNAFSINFLANAVASVSEGYKVATIAMSNYATDFFAGATYDWGTQIAHDQLTQIVFKITLHDDAESASLAIAGMAFGKDLPVFVNDIGVPELEIGEMGASDACYTVTANGSLDVEDGDDIITYTGTKVTYEHGSLAGQSLFAQVANYDSTKFPTLRIGFYADHDVAMAIYADWSTDLTGEGHKTYTAGYNVVTIDMTGKTFDANTFSLKFFVDNNAAAFEGTKTIVFDCIRFLAPLSVDYKNALANGLYDVKTTATEVSWTYDAKNAGAYYNVAVPVENWNEYLPFMNIKVTLSEAMKFGIYNGAEKSNVLDHVAYGAGEYTFSFDLRSCKVVFFTDGKSNAVKFYCDVNNTATDSITKTVTVHSIEFSETAPYVSSPNTNVVTIDYKTEKATFDAKYELAADKDFTNKITSGDVVTPGATLYVREANPVSAPAVFTLAARPAITADNAPTPSVGADFIRFSLAGYEFKLGADGEWATTLGSWANLTPSTEYTVYMRKVATETSFASEAYEMKVSTLASSGGDNTEPTETPKKKKCGSSLATESIIVALALLCAASVVVILRKKRA